MPAATEPSDNVRVAFLAWADDTPASAATSAPTATTAITKRRMICLPLRVFCGRRSARSEHRPAPMHRRCPPLFRVGCSTAGHGGAQIFDKIKQPREGAPGQGPARRALLHALPRATTRLRAGTAHRAA